MMWKIPLYDVYTDSDDIASVIEILKCGRQWSGGEVMEEFESMVASFVDSRFAISFNSGTSALYSTLRCFDISDGDEVIVPSFTFIATANAVKLTGAKPVFCDIEDKQYGIDPDLVTDLITDKTKAIMPIHYGGMPCRILELTKIADQYGLLLIEDAAESLGARYANKAVGTFGDSGMFSLTDPKCISTGEGGIIVTNSKSHMEKLKLFRSHGRSTSNYFSSGDTPEYVDIGHNFRMPSMIAALGCSQIKKIKYLIEKRQQIAEIYDGLINALTSADSMHVPNEVECVYQMYPVFSDSRDELISHLKSLGIMSKICFEPVHKSYYYKNILGYKDQLPVTDYISSRVSIIPCNPTLSASDVSYVQDAIYSFFRR